MNRKITFEKIQNVRDLGGLQTLDGRMIRVGLLLRSANLFGATEADMQKLQEKYHLCKIIDLRTGMEKKEKPDVTLADVNYVENPIFDESVFGISHEKDTDAKQGSMQVPAMEDLYRMIVTQESCRRNLGNAARMIMEHDFTEGSVLWHCTEGKDRCGLLTVVLLGALGVGRQQIMEDYLLTNEVNAPKAEMVYRQMLAVGKNEAEAEAIKNILLAKEAYLNAAFEVIDGQYQGMEKFLTEGLYISKDVIAAFREKVLEKVKR